MKKPFWILIILPLFAACKPFTPPVPSPTSPAVIDSTTTPSLPPPVVASTPAPPDARSQATAFLERWKANDYPGMYSLLSSASQAAISLENFTKHFQGIVIEAALKNIDYEMLYVDSGAEEATAHYRVTFHSSLVPDVQNETAMNLVLENGEWRVKWDDTAVMSYLGGANYLSMNRQDYTPPRGEIYDRLGKLMVGDADVDAVGLNMNTYDPEVADEVISVLSRLSGQPVEVIQQRIDDAMANSVPYLSFGEYPTAKAAGWEGTLNNLPGVEWNTYHTRFYFGSPLYGVAPHVVGYVAQIPPDKVEEFQRQGFRKDEMVGQSGLEQWADSTLLGKRGGALYLRDGNGQVIQTLAESTVVPSQSITTTLNMDFQEAVQQALGDMPGAAVVVERDTGRVLAMASSPAFDPNAFNPANINSYTELSDLNNPLNPLYNRAAQGQYPLGSVFKIVTMAAALESGLFTADSTYECGYFFTDVPGIKLNDWTWEHFQKDGETQPSGHLTLPQGLIRSCDPFFYHIGQVLYDAGQPNAISDMARAFGLGSPTGIQGVSELPGNVPNPVNIEDALVLAIGQSKLQVTPLQVASFVAAVGNGGTLYTPQIIESIGPPGGAPTYVFEPKVRGKLPVKPENLALIQDAMRGVINSKNPYGTAENVFRGLSLPIYGKTGTAQTGLDPHAWFAAYSNANKPNLPDIAVAVVLDHGGEGSEWAAPITRRIFEEYFFGHPGKLYPWESKYNVRETETPTPSPEEIDPNLADEATPTPPPE